MRCQDFSKFIFGKFVSLLSSLLQDAIEADNCRCLHQTCCLRSSSSSHCVCGFLWHCHRQTRQAFGAESVRARQSRCACSGLASLVATTIKVWCHQAEPLLLTGTKAGTATRHEKGPLQQATCSWPIRDLLLKEPSVRIDQLFTSTLQFFPGRFRINPSPAWPTAARKLRRRASQDYTAQSICTQGPTCPRESHTARSS